MNSLLHMDMNELRSLIDTFRPVLHIALILILASVVLRLSRKIDAILKIYMAKRHPDPHSIKRLGTLSGVLRYTASVVIAVIAGMLILGELGISVAPLLATAGVAGIAIGFGAQSLVKDFFTGLFLLLEDQITEGDIIEAAGKMGCVESITLRHLRLRDYDGSVHFIPNGMITTVTNKSREFAYAIVDLNIPRSQNVDIVFKAMRRVAADMRKDPNVGPKILEDIDIAGVEKVEDAAVTIRCRLKVIPLKQWGVRREFLNRIKVALEKIDAESVNAA